MSISRRREVLDRHRGHRRPAALLLRRRRAVGPDHGSASRRRGPSHRVHRSRPERLPGLRRDGRAGGAPDPDILLGAGSIRDPYAADRFIAAGARFIVGPTFDADVARLCNRRRIPYLPGCATPTEIVTAEKCGVEFVKVFPGDSLGPAFVRAIRGPLPEAQVVVTGGVAATEASVREWIAAGAAALGFGSALVTPCPHGPRRRRPIRPT